MFDRKRSVFLTKEANNMIDFLSGVYGAKASEIIRNVLQDNLTKEVVQSFVDETTESALASRFTRRTDAFKKEYGSNPEAKERKKEYHKRNEERIKEYRKRK